MLNKFRLWLAEKLIPKEHRELFVHGFKDELVLQTLRRELERFWQTEKKKLHAEGPFGFSQELLDKMQDARERARTQREMLLTIEEPEEIRGLENSV